MKVNERRTVVGVDWPLGVPPTVERDRRACYYSMKTNIVKILQHNRLDANSFCQ